MDSLNADGAWPDTSLLSRRCWVVQAEWFWLSVQKESCAKEEEYVAQIVSVFNFVVNALINNIFVLFRHHFLIRHI